MYLGQKAEECFEVLGKADRRRLDRKYKGVGRRGTDCRIQQRSQFGIYGYGATACCSAPLPAFYACSAQRDIHVLKVYPFFTTETNLGGAVFDVIRGVMK